MPQSNSFRAKPNIFFVRRPLLLGLIVWYSLMWSWVFVADVHELAGGRAQGLGLATLVFAVNIGLSSLIVFQFWGLVKRANKRFSAPIFLLLAWALFSLADFLVAWLVALVWIGPQGSLDTVLPLGSMALPILCTPLRLASRLVGLYGLAGLGWLLIYSLAHAKTRRLSWAPVVALLVLSAVGSLAFGQVAGSRRSVTIISERVDQKLPPIGGSDLVVFPEYGLNSLDNTNFAQRVKEGSRSHFLGSQQNFQPYVSGHQNNLVFGQDGHSLISIQQKHRLMPGGEDLSYIGRGLLRLTGQTTTLDYFTLQKSVNRGAKPFQPLVLDGQTKLAPGLCSSIIAPQDYRLLVNQGATLLTNSASLTVFGGSKLFGWQQESLGRFMAVANARYFAQSANSAAGYVIDPSGRQVASVSGLSQATVMVTNQTNKTLYTKVGEWLPWAGIGAIIALYYLLYKDKHEKRQSKKSKA